MITRPALRRRMADLRGWLRMLAVVDSPVGRKVALSGARVALERLRTATGPGVRLQADIPYRTHDHHGNPRAVSIDGALQLVARAEAILSAADLQGSGWVIVDEVEPMADSWMKFLADRGVTTPAPDPPAKPPESA